MRVLHEGSGMPALYPLGTKLDSGPENKVHCRGKKSRPPSNFVLGARTHKTEEGRGYERHSKRSSLSTASADLVSSRNLLLQDWHTGMWRHMCVYGYGVSVPKRLTQTRRVTG